LTTLLKQEAPCNSSELDEDENDHDIVLIDSVSDCVDGIAKLLKRDFEPYFQKIFPILLKYLNPKKPDADQVMALGTITECFNAMEERMSPYVPQVLPILLKSIGNSHYNAKRNAIYGIGVVAYFNKQQVQPHLMKILESLNPIFSSPNQYAKAVVDNACGALARFIVADLDMPLDQILPVFLSCLPLREDFEESQICFTSLLHLIQTGNSIVSTQFPDLVNKLAEGLALPSNQLNDHVKSNIVSMLQIIKQKQPQKFEELISQLPQPQSQTLKNI
jgi:hypothetical protein